MLEFVAIAAQTALFGLMIATLVVFAGSFLIFVLLVFGGLSDPVREQAFVQRIIEEDDRLRRREAAKDKAKLLERRF